MSWKYVRIFNIILIDMLNTVSLRTQVNKNVVHLLKEYMILEDTFMKINSFENWKILNF